MRLVVKTLAPYAASADSSGTCRIRFRESCSKVVATRARSGHAIAQAMTLLFRSASNGMDPVDKDDGRFIH